MKVLGDVYCPLLRQGPSCGDPGAPELAGELSGLDPAQAVLPVAVVQAQHCRSLHRAPGGHPAAIEV